MQSSWLTPVAWLIVILTLVFVAANAVFRPNAVKNWLGISNDDPPARTAEQEIALAGLKVEATTLLRAMAATCTELQLLDREVSLFRPAITPLLADPRVAKSRYPALWARATTSTLTAADLARLKSASETLQKVLDQPGTPGLTHDLVKQETERLAAAESDLRSRREAFNEVRLAFTKKK